MHRSRPLSRILVCCLATTLTALALPAQARVGEEVRDYTFPEFCCGDGRQKLSELRGQPVLVATFADVFGGLEALNRAIKLHERYAEDGLVVILAAVKAGSTVGSGTEGVDLGAWMMKRHPGVEIRVCQTLNHPPWDWRGLGLPPYYAVIGADGRLVEASSMPRNPKGMVTGVETAMKQLHAGWGTDEEAAARALLHGKRAYAKAIALGCDAVSAEARAAFEKQVEVATRLMDDGQWLRAAKLTDELGAGSEGVAEFEQAVATLRERLASPEGRRELGLDEKLQKLLRRFANKGPAKGSERPLLRFAEDAADSLVGKRAARLAERVAAAAEIH